MLNSTSIWLNIHSIFWADGWEICMLATNISYVYSSDSVGSQYCPERHPQSLEQQKNTNAQFSAKTLLSIVRQKCVWHHLLWLDFWLNHKLNEYIKFTACLFHFIVCAFMPYLLMTRQPFHLVSKLERFLSSHQPEPMTNFIQWNYDTFHICRINYDE